ncbi:MAG TPA: long-chain fatty acid--CoA ligase [Spirochaetota bacterium]|nr:long-chain fatty acid--CoA ligase [Spirochaetota bacterium]HPS85482.1 long-chain fatty acid--CoA ligase [Spirochaetota bacterium]
MEVKNLALMIHEQVSKYSDKKNALFYKEGNEWIGISWKEFGNRIDNAAKGLLELGVGEKELVAIYSGNKPEWTICDYAIMSVKGSTVAIYATNTAEQAEFIVNNAKIKIIFVEGKSQYDNVMSFFKGNKTLKTVIVYDKSVKIDKNKNVMYLDDLYEIGKKSKKGDVLKKRLKSGTPDDISTIIYTSGTTGDPKGAMLAHKSFFIEMDALNNGFPMGENDIELVFLPLSHVYGKCSLYWVHSKGGTEYFCTDTNKIVEYFQEVRPTYMVGVPRLYEKMYTAIYANIEKASPLKKKIFAWGIETGKKYRYAEIEGKSISPILKIKHSIAFKLVLSNIRNLLGGRLNFFSAGGAPLGKEIEEFFFAANIFIAQGYGLTETAPCGSFNIPSAFKFGTVGKPIAGNQIKIAEDGEILIKGDNVMKGYFGNPAATKEVMTKDGYFMTGDIGIIDEDGFLKITDRKKDIIVTANGKNVAPQGIESKIGQDFYVEQVVIIGDKQKYLTALIVPSFDALKDYAKGKGISFNSNEDLIENPAIIEFYKGRIEEKSKGIAHFEQIQKFTLLAEPFSIERGEITPTMKIKRKVIAANFKDVIKNMY